MATCATYINLLNKLHIDIPFTPVFFIFYIYIFIKIQPYLTKISVLLLYNHINNDNNAMEACYFDSSFHVYTGSLV